MNEPISFELIRSDRKTAAIQLTPDGRVLLRCPRKTTAADARRFIDAHEGWIRSHLQTLKAQPQLPVFSEAELAALTAEAKAFFPERTAYFAPLVGVTYGRISVRHQHSRWGSCSGKGSLNFNCLLMLAPPEVRDYVVVHELCHRLQMNHSPAFWAEVSRVCPDWQLRRQWLREHGSALEQRLPR